MRKYITILEINILLLKIISLLFGNKFQDSVSNNIYYIEVNDTLKLDILYQGIVIWISSEKNTKIKKSE